MSQDAGLGSPSRPPASTTSQHADHQLAVRHAGGQLAASPRSPGRDQLPADGGAGVVPPGRAGGGAGRHRPSLGGGLPAQQRELGTQGRQTVRRLLEAGLAEFDENGFQAARVEDIVRRAKTSHGTFYLYFANKDDLFRTLLRDALHDMAIITDDFPVVTSNEAGRAALRRWVRSFSEAYAAHGPVLRILSQADVVGENVYGDGLQLLFRISEAITQGMTAAPDPRTGEPVPESGEHAELTALACLLMLERVNFLSSAEVRLPMDEMNDRIADIIYAAFRAS